MVASSVGSCASSSRCRAIARRSSTCPTAASPRICWAMPAIFSATQLLRSVTVFDRCILGVHRASVARARRPRPPLDSRAGTGCHALGAPRGSMSAWPIGPSPCSVTAPSWPARGAARDLRRGAPDEGRRTGRLAARRAADHGPSGRGAERERGASDPGAHGRRGRPGRPRGASSSPPTSSPRPTPTRSTTTTASRCGSPTGRDGVGLRAPSRVIARRHRGGSCTSHASTPVSSVSRMPRRARPRHPLAGRPRPICGLASAARTVS